MGRESDPSVVVHSSIALLQERFRQLQRVKEMRQETELLRLFPESKRISPATAYEPSKLFFCSESILPPRPPTQSSRYSECNMQGKHTEAQVVKTTSLEILWSRDTVTQTTKFQESDVDTSLHL